MKWDSLDQYDVKHGPIVNSECAPWSFQKNQDYEIEDKSLYPQLFKMACWRPQLLAVLAFWSQLISDGIIVYNNNIINHMLPCTVLHFVLLYEIYEAGL